ncbi:MAG: hypothetical protein ACPGEG_02615 [Salibacteraceae bacterium]
MRKLISFLLLCFSLISCIDQKDYDLDRFAKTSWNPELGFPLVNSKVGVDKLFGNSDSNAVTSNSDGLIVLVYQSKEMEIGVSEFFAMPELLEVPTTTIPVVPGQSQSIKIPFPTTDGAKIDRLEIESGELIVGLNTGQSGTVKFTFTSIKDAGGSAAVENVPTNQASVSRDLADHALQMNAQGEFEVTVDFTNASSGSGKPVIEFRNIVYKKIEGDFGQKNITLRKDSLKLHLFKSLAAQGNFALTNPTVEVHVENTVGIPLELDLSDMNGYNEVTNQRNSIFSAGGKFNLSGGTVANPSDNSIIIDKSNSTIREVIQPTPVYLQYSPAVTVNPGGVPSPLNTIEKNCGVKMATSLKLPLDGSIQGLAIHDTLDFNVEALFDLIKDFTVSTVIKNGFPFNVNVTLQLLDSTYAPVMDIKNQPVYLMDKRDVFTSGTPGANQRIDQNNLVQLSEEYVMDSDVVSALFKGRYVRMIGYFETFNNGTVPVKVFDDYHLDVKLGVKVTGNINF